MTAVMTNIRDITTNSAIIALTIINYSVFILIHIFHRYFNWIYYNSYDNNRYFFLVKYSLQSIYNHKSF